MPLRPSGVRESARRVLIVEDDDDSRELLEMMLAQKGYAVQVAANGGQALAVAAAFVPEVVLTDITLPDVDGFELAERLRELPMLKACRLVAITGHTDVKQRVRAADFDRYLVKPVSIQAVIAAVEGDTELPSAAG